MASMQEKMRSLVTANDSTSVTHDAEVHKDGGHVHVHAVSPLVLLSVFGALLVLTVLTVAVTYVDLGPANLIVALGIAVVKAALVLMFFMHLWWDRPFNAVVLVAAFFFVALFLGFTIMDTDQYQINMTPPAQMSPK